MTFLQNRLLTRLFAAALGVFAANAARADCGPVIAAYEKADATGRFEWFEMTDMNQAPSGDPAMIRIGEVTYAPIRSGPKSMVGKYGETGLMGGVMSGALKRREGEGKASCAPLAGKTVRGEPAVGFAVTGGVAISKGAPPSEEVWISRAAGTPIAEGMDGADRGWVVWIYGAGVMTPPKERLLD